jgi:hypothetical protein
MSALDIAPVIQGVMLTDLEAADEVKCEADHAFGDPCTVSVAWSRGPYPCGCVPRTLVCQGVWNLVFLNCPRPRTQHHRCGQTFPTSEWRKGWFPV